MKTTKRLMQSFSTFKFLVIAMLATAFGATAASACSCEGGNGPYPQGVLRSYVEQHYGKAAAETLKIKRQFRYSLFEDKFLYLIEGSPKPTGGNCWSKNQNGQPLHDCTRDRKMRFDIHVQQVGQSCEQTLTISTTETSSKLLYTVPVCKYE